MSADAPDLQYQSVTVSVGETFPNSQAQAPDSTAQRDACRRLTERRKVRLSVSDAERRKSRASVCQEAQLEQSQLSIVRLLSVLLEPPSAPQPISLLDPPPLRGSETSSRQGSEHMLSKKRSESGPSSRQKCFFCSTLPCACGWCNTLAEWRDTGRRQLVDKRENWSTHSEK